MRFTHEILEVSNYQRQNLLPATILNRVGTSVWLVRHKPLGVEDPDAWGWVNSGEFVRVPAFPYMSGSTDPEIALGHAWQLGFQAREAVGDVGRLVRVHLVLGSPVEEVSATGQGAGFRYWIGFAAEVLPRSQP